MARNVETKRFGVPAAQRVESLRKTEQVKYAETVHTHYRVPQRMAVVTAFEQVKRYKPNAYAFQVNIVTVANRKVVRTNSTDAFAQSASSEFLLKGSEKTHGVEYIGNKYGIKGNLDVGEVEETDGVKRYQFFEIVAVEAP